MVHLPLNNTRWKNQHVNQRSLVAEVRDRIHPTDKALGWLLIERKEIYQYNHSINLCEKASIRLSYQQFWPSVEKNNGCFRGTFRYHLNTVGGEISLTGGNVFLNLKGLRGQRIGTYLMNEIVLWSQQWPEAIVKNITVRRVDAEDADDKARRNWFYEQFGIEFEYDDDSKRAGSSRRMQVKKLKTVETWKQNIFLHKISEYLMKINDAQKCQMKELKKLNERLSACENRYARLSAELREAEDHPISWIWHQLKLRYFISR
jgi:hypothetical protein